MFVLVRLPRGFWPPWNPHVLWLRVTFDSLVALASFLIPFALVRILLLRRGTAFNSTALSVTAFAAALGVTYHVLDMVTLWHPAYWVGGVLKIATVAIAIATFALLLRLMPVMLATPSHAELKEIFNRQTASVLESTTVCVIAVDSKWKVHYMNRNAATLLKREEESTGMTFWDVFPGQQASEREILIHVMETRQPSSFEGYYLPLDLSSTVQVHPWHGGGIAVFFSDVSEQKRLQRELERERATRDQRIGVLAQFSAGLAHEIKNPLAVIHARASDLAELADETNILPADVVREACRSIVQTADRTIRILRGLEALAGDGAHDPMQKADVGAMVHLAMDLVQRRYDRRGITLETMVPPGLPMVVCHDVQIGQVLLNLLNNAFDAIEASPKSERWVRVEVSIDNGGDDAGERLLIDVVDGGPALDEKTKEHLMEAFYTTKTLGAGTGVGLSISLAIAEEHRGGLELRDREGHTCFRLTLPLKRTHAEGVAA